MSRLLRWFSVLVAAGCGQAGTVCADQVDTGWLTASAYQAQFDELVAAGRYPPQVYGRNNNNASEYRGYFCPTTAAFYSCHGHTLESYTALNGTESAQGYKRVWVQSFVDGSGIERYQATWVK